MKEIYKDCLGYEKTYQVSNFGNVRSKNRVVLFSDGRKRMFKGCEKSLILNKKRGYLYVNLKVNGINKFYSVHRLVAENFLIKENEKYVVDHIDKNRLNNKVDNLRWVSHRFNTSRHENKTSLFIGVCWHKRHKKWMASIYKNNKINHIGYFESELDASISYQKELRNV